MHFLRSILKKYFNLCNENYGMPIKSNPLSIVTIFMSGYFVWIYSIMSLISSFLLYIALSNLHVAPLVCPVTISFAFGIPERGIKYIAGPRKTIPLAVYFPFAPECWKNKFSPNIKLPFLSEIFIFASIRWW